MNFLFLVYLFLLIVRPHEYVSWLVGVPLPRYVLLLSFVAWLFQPGKSFRAPQYVLVPSVVMAAALSLIAMGWLGGVIEVLDYFLPLLMVFVVAARVAEEPKQLERVFRVICLCALVLVAHGMDQVYTDGYGWTGQPTEPRFEPPRIQYIGVFGDANDLGMLFVGCIPLCVYLAGRGRGVTKPFWYASLCMLFFGSYLTRSRGTLVAILTLLAVWAVRRYGFVAGAVLGALLIPVLVGSTRLATISTEEASAAGRIDAWYEGLQMFEANPIFGVGYQIFADLHEKTAHNSWILVLAELGLVGYLPWFLATGMSLQMLWIVGSNVERSEQQTEGETKTAEEFDDQLAWALLWSSFGMLVAAFFLTRSYEVLMFLIWAWSAGHYTGALRRSPGLPPVTLATSGPQWCFVALCSIAGLYIMVRVLLVVL